MTHFSDLAIGMKLFGKKWQDVWYKGTLVEIQNKDRPLSEVWFLVSLVLLFMLDYRLLPSLRFA